MLQIPAKIEDVIKEWKLDSIIDSTDLGKELLKISQLHAKYSSVLVHHNLVVKKLNSDYLKLKKVKFEYYTNKLNNSDDLDKYDYEPAKKIQKTDLPYYMDSDEEIINILLKKSMNEEIVEFVKMILKELQNRTWQLKTYVDYQKYMLGQ